MGFGSKARTESVVNAVKKATMEGRKRIVVELGGDGLTRTSPIIDGWSNTIERIEDMGWQMTHFSAMQPESDRLQATTQGYAAFRRVR